MGGSACINMTIKFIMESTTERIHGLYFGRHGLQLRCDIAYLVGSTEACGWQIDDSTLQDYRPNWAVEILEYDRHVYYTTHYLSHFEIRTIGALCFISDRYCASGTYRLTMWVTDQC